MRLIRQFRRWLSRAVNYREESTCFAKEDSDMCDMPNGFTFTLLSATGGMVVSVTCYDTATGNRSRNLYILPDGCNVGEELGIIITRERLR